MQTSPFASPAGMEAKAVYADMDMVVYCVLDEDGVVWIFHDKTFSKTLSWIEYDMGASRLDFILEDGDIRNFGIPVDPKLGRYLQNMQSISVVLKRGGQIVDGEVYPLILHAA
jgi:hypothetical protein